MIKRLAFMVLGLLAIASVACTPKNEGGPSGKLFIIGGGERSDALIEKMLQTADLQPKDTVFILPMASSIPDTTTLYIKRQILKQGAYAVESHNFTREEAIRAKKQIARVARAKLIYIPGGDQNRFMDVVGDTPLYKALHEAYQGGATLAGTSAGAAVMSAIMLTGEQKLNVDNGNDVLWKDNIETRQGLGFLSSDIIDQHFIKRSRFNRLLSVVADHPDKQGIGIDESTAIICHQTWAQVVGEGQVVVLSAPTALDHTAEHLISFEHINFSVFTAGDRFELFSK